MKKYFFTIVFLSLSLFVPVFSYADSVSKANRLYRGDKFDDALKTYNEALAKQPESAIINFDIGDTLYKKKDYQSAVDAFSKALLSPDPKLEADANYNIGNCKYKMGKLKETADLSGAVNLYREALDYYKRAIELDQNNKDARYNHELVEKQLKILLDKIKPPPQDKQQPQNGQCPLDKEKKEGDGENKERNQPQEQEDAKPAEEETEKDSEQKASREEENKDEMSEEEARMILERYNRDDLSGDLNHPRRTGSYPQVLKDW